MALGVPKSKFWDHFSIQLSPLKPPFRESGSNFGPRKSDFWPFLLILVIFPLKFPLKPKKITANARKCPTAKTKTVLESVKKMEPLVGMSKAKFRNSLK